MAAQLVLQTPAGWLVLIVVGLFTWFAGGKTDLASIIEALVFLSAWIFIFFFSRYLSILEASAEPGSERGNSSERDGYDELRKDLADDERHIARLYTRLLTRCLDATDRFFGDFEKPNRTLSKVFMLREPFPLWTTASFDTCLVLALVYPIATVFFFWTVFGHVGDAESALTLKPDLSRGDRWLAFAAVLVQILAMRYFVISKSLKSAVIAFAVAVVLAVKVSVAAAGAIGLAQGAYFGAEVSLLSGVSLGILWIIAFTAATAWTLPDLPSALLATAVAAIFAVTMFANRAIPADRHTLKSVYLAILVPGAITVCGLAAYVLSSLVVWNFIGPLLLFGAVMTVLNAPFDWLSVGLTRGLLRRGIEMGGTAPLLFSLLDVFLATFLIIALVPVMVIGVQFFDRIAVHGGGHPILPLVRFFEGIEADPLAPVFWWVYALLFSTMIPSLFNICVGAFSIIRVFSPLSPLLLKQMPADRAIASYNRKVVAFFLTLQAFAGVVLGFLIQGFLIYGILVLFLPMFGLELLHIARLTADFDFPSLVGLL